MSYHVSEYDLRLNVLPFNKSGIGIEVFHDEERDQSFALKILDDYTSGVASHRATQLKRSLFLEWKNYTYRKSQERNILETYFLRWNLWKTSEQKKHSLIEWFQRRSCNSLLRKVFNSWTRQTMIYNMIILKNRQYAEVCFNAWVQETNIAKGLRERIDHLLIVRNQRHASDFLFLLQNRVTQIKYNIIVEQMRARQLIKLVVRCFDFWREKSAEGAILRQKIRIIKLKREERNLTRSLSMFQENSVSKHEVRQLIFVSNSHFRQRGLEFAFHNWIMKTEMNSKNRLASQNVNNFRSVVLLEKSILAWKQHSLMQRKIHNSLVIRDEAKKYEALNKWKTFSVKLKSWKHLELSANTFNKLKLFKRARGLFLNLQRRIEAQKVLNSVLQLSCKRKNFKMSAEVFKCWRDQINSRRSISEILENKLCQPLITYFTRRSLNEFRLLDQERLILDEISFRMKIRRDAREVQSIKELAQEALLEWSRLTKISRMGKEVLKQRNIMTKKSFFSKWISEFDAKENSREEACIRMLSAYKLRLKFKAMVGLRENHKEGINKKKSIHFLFETIYRIYMRKVFSHIRVSLDRIRRLEDYRIKRIERKSKSLVRNVHSILLHWKSFTYKRLKLKQRELQLKDNIVHRRFILWMQSTRDRKIVRDEKYIQLSSTMENGFLNSHFQNWKSSTIRRFKRREAASQIVHILSKNCYRVALVNQWLQITLQQRRQDTAVDHLIMRAFERNKSEALERRKFCFDFWKQIVVNKNISEAKFFQIQFESKEILFKRWRVWAEDQAFVREHSLMRTIAHKRIRTLSKCFQIWEDSACEIADQRRLLSNLVAICEYHLFSYAMETLVSVNHNANIRIRRENWLNVHVVHPLERRRSFNMRKNVFSKWLDFAENSVRVRSVGNQIKTHIYLKSLFENWKKAFAYRQVRQKEFMEQVHNYRAHVMVRRCFTALREYSRLQSEEKMIEHAVENWSSSRRLLKVLSAWRLVTVKRLCWREAIKRLVDFIERKTNQLQYKAFWHIYKKCRKCAAVDRLICLLEYKLNWVGENNWIRTLKSLSALQESWKALTVDEDGDNPFSIALGRVFTTSKNTSSSPQFSLDTVLRRSWQRSQLSEVFQRFKLNANIFVEDALLTHLMDDSKTFGIIRGIPWLIGLCPGLQTVLKVGDGPWHRARVRFELSMMLLGSMMVTEVKSDLHSSVGGLEGALTSAIADFIIVYLPMWCEEFGYASTALSNAFHDEFPKANW